MARVTLHPVLGRREQTKARNRATILAAARRVFGTLGYDAATVRDIVRATDLSVGTFYQYFRDREEIFAAVAEEAWAGLRARLRAARRDTRVSLEERVERAYLAYFRFVEEESTLNDVIERMFWSRDAVAERSVRLGIQDLREDLELDFNAAALGGEDAALVAAAMVGTGLLVAREVRSRGSLDPKAAARFCARFVLGNLAPGSNARKPAGAGRRKAG